VEAAVSIHNLLTALSGVTEGGLAASRPHWQAKCRSWAPLVDILTFSFL